MTFRHRRTAKKARLFLLLLAFLAFGTVRPRPARAVDTAVIVISSIAAYVVFIVGGTWLVYTRKHTSQQPLMPEADLLDADRRESGTMRLAPHCRTADGTMALLCW